MQLLHRPAVVHHAGLGRGGAKAAPQARCRAGCAYAHPPGWRACAEDARAEAELEGNPLGKRACDALELGAAEGARAPAAGRAGELSGVHPRHHPKCPQRRAEAYCQACS